MFTLTVLMFSVFFVCVVAWAFLSILVFLSPVINIAVTVLAVLNCFVVAALLIFRHFWKRAGKLDKDYISGFTGWKKGGLLVVKYTLLLLLIWEVLFVAACVLFLFFQPINTMIGATFFFS